MRNAYEHSPPRRLHKWARVQAPSAEWRARLLANCVQRVKTSRQEDLQQRRKKRMQIICEEVDRLQSPFNFDGTQNAPVLTDMQLSTLIDDLEAAIEAESREAEAVLISEFEALRAESEDDISELVDFHHRVSHPASQHGEHVTCPVCVRDVLHVRQGVVFCACGLRLDGGTCDNLTIDIVSERISQTVSEHNAHCQSLPTFQLQNALGKPSNQSSDRSIPVFLWATCSQCQFESVVL